MAAQMVLKLSQGQHMALIGVLLHYLKTDEPQEFVDVINQKTTTAYELLSLLMEAPVVLPE